ncbi:MAG: hypothetical protein KF893_27105, partial [Caldilineaceae bacterium]|nr:hypothetical protein [Caldilineaceae bacterium]
MSQDLHDLLFRKRSQRIEHLIQHLATAQERSSKRMTAIVEGLHHSKEAAATAREVATQRAYKIGENRNLLMFIGFIVGGAIGFVLDTVVFDVLPAFSLIGAFLGGFMGFESNMRSQRTAEDVAFNDYKQNILTAEKQAQLEEKKAQKKLQSAITEYKQEISNLIAETQPVGSSWWVKDWQSWKPVDTPMGVVRLGEIRPESAQESLTLLLPFPGDQGLLYLIDGGSRLLAIQSLQSSLLRLLATVPAGKLRFTFVDP